MIRVCAPSRLHFGLLSLAGESPWPDRHGEPLLPARRFGSVGLMIETPGVRLTVAPAATWSAVGPLAERALEFAHRFRAGLTLEQLPPQRLIVEQAAPEHVGLGTGTQLGLAVAQAMALAASLPPLPVHELARRVGRGLRSGLGIHGFARGGFLVDGGKGAADTLAPRIARATFPDSWRVVLTVPPLRPGLHGVPEQQAFARLQRWGSAVAHTDALCRLVLLGMLPALAEQDLDAFGEAAHDFNARVGEAFASVQGGAYADPRVAEIVDFVRCQGVTGTGQSSWGPAVFAVAGDPERAEDLAARLRRHFGFEPERVLVTRACNRGASAG